jgi:hypothetical protein
LHGPVFILQEGGCPEEAKPKRKPLLKHSGLLKGETKMKGRTVLALLVVAFVGWNLLLGASVKSSGMHAT